MESVRNFSRPGAEKKKQPQQVKPLQKKKTFSQN